MQAPIWLQQIVQEFGTQLGLNTFALNDHDTAGARFENGLNFQLEYRAELLFGYILLPVNPTPNNLLMALKLVAPEYLKTQKIHAAYAPQAKALAFIAKLPERETTVPKLQELFLSLWKTASTAADKLNS